MKKTRIRKRSLLERRLPKNRVGDSAWWLLTIPAVWGIHKVFTMSNPLKRGEQRRLSRLLPSVRDKVIELRNGLRKLGIDIHVGSTSRTKKQQLENLKAGRSAIVRSWHRVNRAADIYVINPKTGKVDTDAERLDLYKIVHDEAKKLGFRVLGTGILRGRKTEKHPKGKPFRDPFHVELREGLTWREAYRNLQKNV